MSTSSKKMPWNEAWALARGWVERLRPLCDRVEIAGSLRRRVDWVGDLEIVALPKLRLMYTAQDLLGPDYTYHLSYDHPSHDAPNVPERQRYNAKRKDRQWAKEAALQVAARIGRPVKVVGGLPGKYTQVALPEGITLDLFTPEPDAWALVFLIRTGSAEFVHALAQHSRRLGFTWHEGRVYKTIGRDREAKPIGEPYRLENEEDVFRFFGVRWVPPTERTGADALKAAIERRPGYNRAPNWRR